MKRETRNTLIVFAVIALLLGGAYGGIAMYSGVSPPFTVVNSGSMQHSQTESKIGIIDTGDMMIVKDPDTKTITTYVEGAKSGYISFGEYGDVIVYHKDTSNIIHRAMIYMELKQSSGGTIVWYIPSLAGYDDWEISSGSSINTKVSKSPFWNESECTLTLTSSESGYYFWLTNVGYADLDVSINLYTLGHGKTVGHSGYLTKGDNATTNKMFDQACGIYGNMLVEKSKIKSVAIFEIPWIGCIKLMVKGNTSSIPSNSIYGLVSVIVGLILLIVAINIYAYYHDKKKAADEAEKIASQRKSRRR